MWSRRRLGHGDRVERTVEVLVFLVGMGALVLSVAVRRARPRLGNSTAVAGVLLIAGVLIL